MDLLESNRKVQHARAATILGLAKLAEYRDEGTGTHLERIREYARLLAGEMARLPGHPAVHRPALTSTTSTSRRILHDIGKVGIPDAVLLKPGELTDEEFEVIKCHTRFGGDALAAIEAQIEGRSFLHLGQRDRLQPPREVGRVRLPCRPQGRTPSLWRHGSWRWPTSTTPSPPGAFTRKPFPTPRPARSSGPEGQSFRSGGGGGLPDAGRSVQPGARGKGRSRRAGRGRRRAGTGGACCAASHRGVTCSHTRP